VSQSLAVTIAVYGFASAAWCGGLAATGRDRGRATAGAAFVLEAGALGQLVAAGIVAHSGHDLAEPLLLAAYLLVSVAILTIFWAATAADGSAWGTAILALGMLTVAVVSLRAIAVWQL